MTKQYYSHVKKAAVLIPMAKIAEQWHVLFIRRTERAGDKYSGQVAFPGGKYESETDPSLKITAIRETNEEIGLKASDIQIIGQMRTHTTLSDYEIYPYAGVITWPTKLTPQITEVARIFTIPLAWLQNKQNYSFNQYKNRSVLFFKPYDGELLWGATAQMTLTFLEALRQGRIDLNLT